MVPIHVRTDEFVHSRRREIFSKLAQGAYPVSVSEIHFHTGLEKYGGIDRSAMERTPGIKYRTLHDDFMMEKSVVLDDTLAVHGSALFLDCDIVFLRALEDLSSWDHMHQTPSKSILLSPHHINPRDEEMFGRFNGGWVATNDRAVPRLWEEYTTTSRYFDQAALERFVPGGDRTVEYAPPQSNFGYWRLFQASRPRNVLGRLTVGPLQGGLVQKTLLYDGKPLQSVHSHFVLPALCGTPAQVFNRLICGLLEECGDTYGFALDMLRQKSAWN